MGRMRTAVSRVPRGRSPGNALDPMYSGPVLAKRVKQLERAVSKLLQERMAMCRLLIEDSTIGLLHEELKRREDVHNRRWREFKTTSGDRLRDLRGLLDNIPVHDADGG